MSLYSMSDRAHRRMMGRLSQLRRKRPQSPRELAFAGNFLTWKPPQDDTAISHYRVRVDTDIGDPKFQVPAGQHSVPLYGGERFYVTAYNDVLDVESVPAILGAAYGEGTGNVSLDGIIGSLIFSSMTVELGAPNDFGLRFWIITCNYSSNIKDLQYVHIWLENPKDGAAEKIGDARFISGQSNQAVAAVLPPNSTRDIRVYLVPITSTMSGELRTVAEFGVENASPHKESSIGPVPTETQGVEWTANVTGFVLSTGYPKFFYDAAGLYRGKLRFEFTPPSDARWGGIELVVKRPGPIFRSLGRFADSPTPEIEVDVPPSVQSWRAFPRGFDKAGKLNSINESGQGVATPFVDFNIGDTLGKLDLGKALINSVGSALEVVNNVLGVMQGGIGETLISDFAVSKAKLLNAPIIDALRIEDLAVKNNHVESLAAEKILAGTLAAGVAYIGELSALQITSGTMSAERIGAGTMSVGTGGLTVSGSGGLTVSGGGFVVSGEVFHVHAAPNVAVFERGLHTDGAFSAAISINTVEYKRGDSVVINTFSQFVGAGVDAKGSGIGGNGFNYWNGSSYEFGATATFTSQDGKTVTVKGGVITSVA